MSERSPLARLKIVEVIDLSPEASEALVNLLLDPPEPIENLRSAAERYRAMVEPEDDDAGNG